MVERIKQFFFICSGANLETLRECSSEGSKYVGIGATIFFTGIFAALSGAYALYTVFGNIWTAALLGTLWGLMIFNLDRYIVSSMRKGGKPVKELLMATPRLVLAIFISIVIAKPLELKIFEKEINEELQVMQQEAYDTQLANLKQRFVEDQNRLSRSIEDLKNEINNKARLRDTLQLIAQKEADGTGGTKRRNPGPIYKIKKEAADQAQQELDELTRRNNLQILANQQAKDSLTTVEALAIERLKLESPGGMASRLEAMSRLSSKSNAVLWANWFVMILFVLIECAPVLVKLMSPPGPYDYQLGTIHYQARAEHIEALARINHGIKKKNKHLANHESDFLNEELNLGINES